MRFAVPALFLFAPLLASAAEPWDLAPFAADPRALYERAASVPTAEGEPVAALLQEMTLRYTEDGRVERQVRLVYRIVDASAIEGWSEVSAYWSPWYQEQPALRARVIDSTHRVHELDPATIAQQPASDGTYSDARIERAPLPAMSAGVVVEEMVTVREHRPFFVAGSIERFSPGMSVRTQRARLIVEAPDSLHLTFGARGVELPSPVSETGTEGRTRRIWEWGPLDADDDYEMYTPLDVVQFAEVTISTGTSWESVAAAYGRIFEDVLKDADVRSRTAAAVDGATSEEDRIRRILASIQRDVRYVAIELGEGSIVPRTPADTLRRGFGDCKDQAALLIAMLRQAGIDAQPALLRAAGSTDIDPGLPGLGMFNHVIVYLPSSTVSWIDPTDEFARAGELPSGDQGRLALVAAEGESELRTIPLADADQVRTSIVVRYELAESGAGSVRETIRPGGNSERYSRRALAVSDRAEYDERLKELAKERYLAKDASVTIETAPSDLENPFEIELRAATAGRTATADGEAAAALDVRAGFDYLPADLLTKPEEGEDERRHPWYFEEPVAIEHRFIVAAPDGYRARPVPDDQKLSLGPLSWSLAWKLLDERTVEAVARVESGATSWTPEQLAAAREDAQRVTREMSIIYFDQIARLHIGKGDLKAAIEEVERLAALHPAEALHASDLSSILLTAGLNESAIETARRATSTEPTSSAAWQQLGWALQHDAVGRRFSPGWNRTEAVAAYRKAIELDPQNQIARADLAILLEHDELGIRYSQHASLPEAIAEYRALKTETEAKEFDGNLATALYHAQRWSELETFAGEGELVEGVRDSMSVVAALMTGGVEAAIRVLERLPLKRRGDAALASSQLAVIHRHYELAGRMVEEAMRTASPERAAELANLREQLRRAKKIDPAELDPSDPRNVVTRAILAAFDPRIDEAAVRAFALESSVPYLMDPDDPDSFASARETAIRTAREGTLPLFAADMTAAALEWQIEEDGFGGAVARMLTSYGNDESPAADLVFLVKEKEQWKYVGADTNAAAIGAAIHTFLDAGQNDRAAQWLDWMLQARPGFRLDDPLVADSFSLFWNEGEEADPELMRTAAHLLTIMSEEHGAEGEAWLGARRARWSGVRQDAVELMLAQHYIDEEQYELVEPLAAALLDRHPSSDLAFMTHASVLVELGKPYDLEGQLGAPRMRRERERSIRRMIYSQAQEAGDVEKAAAALRELVRKGLHEPGDLNNLAWLTLFGAGTIEEGLEMAQRASGAGSGVGGNAALLHTLASLYADAGRAAEARDALLKAVDQRGSTELLSHDWYVIGRIAEAYGVEDAARSAYLRVKGNPDDDDESPTSTWQLASRRLAAMSGS